MSHNHNHSHHHTPTNYNRVFIISLLLNMGFVLIETFYGLLVHSLALLADAGHNLSDVLGLLLAWGASFMARRLPTYRHTYGWRRSSILAALLNAIFLILAMSGIAWEAIQSFNHPQLIPGKIVIGVAIVGVIINTATALMFVSGRKTDLNLRGAFLHMAADAMVSLGVVIAGIAMLMTGWYWFDPIVSLIIVIVVLYGTWELLKDALNLALDGVPEEIEPLAVRTYLNELSGVKEIHDLHIWGMSTTEIALTVHLVMPDGFPGDAFIAKISRELHDNFGIDHSTLQVETGDPNYPCLLAPDHIV